MSVKQYQPSVRRLAVTTACLSLLPIVVGALVTTLNAGMAFLDWPSSDGHNMFLYPLFSVLRTAPDKFIEHSHRLAGALIGVVSIILVVITWKNETRRWIRNWSLAILLAVIAQGILGGIRVRLNEQTWAMIHGSFAAIVFTMMTAMALFTSKSWWSASTFKSDNVQKVKALKPWILMTIVLLACQYLLGGTLRHLGMSLHEHIGLAVVLFLMTLFTAIRVFDTRHPWLRGSAIRVMSLLTAQVVLGLGAFATRFGLPFMDYVAVQNSNLQAVVQTSHTVVGMLLFATTVLLAVRIFHLDWLNTRSQSLEHQTPNPSLASSLSINGGVS